MGVDKFNCGEKFAKWFLVALNVIFVILGLVLFILGMIVRFSPEVILNSYIQPLLSQGNTAANNNQLQLPNQLNNIDLSAFFNVIGIVIIIIGVIMLAVGFLGLFGACCEVRCMLIGYAIVVIVVLIIQFGCFIAYFTQKTKIDELIRQELQTIITNEYRGETATDTYSLALNYIFIELECCGVDGFRDMQSARRWSRQYQYGGRSYTVVHPFTCCKLPGTFPNYERPADLTCAVTPTTVNSNFDQGCFQKIDEFISNQITVPVIVVFVLFGAIEITAIVFAILLSVAIGRNGW